MRRGVPEEGRRNNAVCPSYPQNPEDALAQLAIVLKHALHGDRDRLLAFLTGEFETHLWNDPEVPEWVAGWLALVGEREKALDWLEHWINRGSINYPMLAHSDPLLEPLRGEPRFQRLLDRIHPEWERFVPPYGEKTKPCRKLLQRERLATRAGGVQYRA